MRSVMMHKRFHRTRLSVDYPRQGERIRCPVYTTRIAAPDDVRAVEVAVDQGAWRPCRRSVGYWWYDWAGYASGEHEIIARIKTRDGAIVSSEPHEFFVDLEPQEREANA